MAVNFIKERWNGIILAANILKWGFSYVKLIIPFFRVGNGDILNPVSS